MGRTVGWVARAVVATAASAAATASAQDFLIHQDPPLRVVEGSGPSILNITITRTFFGPDTDVFWKTVEGSAWAGFDFTPVTSGSVHFGPGDTSKTIPVTIVGDSTPEQVGTQQDEVFFVELTGVSGVGTIQKGRTSVTIVDDDSNQPGAQFLSVVSDGTLTSGRNRLQWRVPAGQPNAPFEFEIRWDKGTTCSVPTTTSGGIAGSGRLPANLPGTVQSFPHTVSTPHDLWCYSVFTFYPALSSQIASVKTKTLDSGAGPIKWTYTHTSALPNLAPPTIGQDAVYAVDNSGVLHAMVRGAGASSGVWPPSVWHPVALGGTAFNRSPVVPFGGGSRIFIGTENGTVYSVDGRTGTIHWARSPAFGATGSQLMTGATGAQAPPALMLKDYNGTNDLLLVGTATGANNTKFFALNPATGATIDDYPNGGDTPPGPVRNVFGMPIVDYAGNRVYVATTGTNPTDYTFWSLDLGPMNAPDLTLTSTLTLPWNPKALGTGIGTTGSPVLRNGWLYLGTGNVGNYELHALRLSDGDLDSYNHGDGQVKGFPWPDRRNGRLYFSTPNLVHAAYHDGSSLVADPNWVVARGGNGSVPMTNPSPVLQRPGTDELYVGDLGRLVRLDAATGAQVGVLMLDPGALIGAPSLDNFHNLLLVGSDRGVIYAVQAGF